MLTCSNISTKKTQVENEKLFVIWSDIRGSTILNEKYSSTELYDMYSEALDSIYSILKDNGFVNIDIQGDGIYGVSDKRDSSSLIKATKEINEALIESIGDPNGNDLMTVSIHYGKETFSCFGPTTNDSQMAFFGNVVSESKKWISNSVWNDDKKTRIIISADAAEKIGLTPKSELAKELNVSIKGKRNKKFKGYY